jgi:hypothetical protein
MARRGRCRKSVDEIAERLRVHLKKYRIFRLCQVLRMHDAVQKPIGTHQAHLGEMERELHSGQMAPRARTAEGGRCRKAVNTTSTRVASALRMAASSLRNLPRRWQGTTPRQNLPLQRFSTVNRPFSGE